MSGSHVAIYYAWDRPEEIAAPLGTIEDRFPALFELRRMLYPHLRELADPLQFEQGVGGFLDHVMKRNFASFVDLASALTGNPVPQFERVNDHGDRVLLDDGRLRSVDTLIVISFDSLRTRQQASSSELSAVRTFLATPGHLLAVCPHHDIGESDELSIVEQQKYQEEQFRHHGDRTLPPRQRFGGFARSLLSGLGVPVENRFGLHPAAEPDGSPTPIEAELSLDRLGLLEGVATFNLHPHLPHLERLRTAARRLDVLARQRVDLKAPPHPFTSDGRSSFDALLQSKVGVFAGDLLVGDATLWSSTAGGVASLRTFWSNVIQRGTRQ